MLENPKIHSLAATAGCYGTPVFGRDDVLGTLGGHQLLAPVGFPLQIAVRPWTAREQCDLFERELGAAVHVEQSVRFLIGVGELCVAEAGEQRRGAHHFQQPAIPVCVFALRTRTRVAPGVIDVATCLVIVTWYY